MFGVKVIVKKHSRNAGTEALRTELMPVKGLPFISLTKASVMSGYLVMGFERNPLYCAQIPVDGSEVVFCCEFLL